MQRLDLLALIMAVLFLVLGLTKSDATSQAETDNLTVVSDSTTVIGEMRPLANPE